LSSTKRGGNGPPTGNRGRADSTPTPPSTPPTSKKRKADDLSTPVPTPPSTGRTTRSQTMANNAPPISNGTYKSVPLDLNEAVKNKNVSPLRSARIYTAKQIRSYKAHRLPDTAAAPLLQHFSSAQKAWGQGTSYVASTHDAHNRPLSVFGVAENVQHDRGLTPAVSKRSKNEDSSHGFPQSSVSNPFQTDQVRRMTAENFVGNQATTRTIEEFMAKQHQDLLKNGHIGKLRETSFHPNDNKTHSPSLVRDTVLRRTDSMNHIEVLFSAEHTNPDIER
jgi:hypothetical protein